MHSPPCDPAAWCVCCSMVAWQPAHAVDPTDALAGDGCDSPAFSVRAAEGARSDAKVATVRAAHAATPR